MDSMSNETLFCYESLNNITKCIENSTRTGLFVLAISNALLAVPTAAANALVIVAILTTSSLRTPSYLLLTSLAFSDLLVGILTQPVLSAMIFEILLKHKIGTYLLATLTVGAVLSNSVSVFTLMAISVDRYLAIRLKMRYRSVVTVRKVRCYMVMVWTLAVLVTSYIIIDRKIGQVLGILSVVFVTICLLVIAFCYTMSFRALKIHCTQTQPQGNQQPNNTTQSNVIDVLKYRKLLKTMVLVFMLVFICHLPLIVLFSILLRSVGEQMITYWFLISIVYLHSTLNPVIYITRMGDIRQACIRIIRKLSFK